DFPVEPGADALAHEPITKRIPNPLLQPRRQAEQSLAPALVSEPGPPSDEDTRPSLELSGNIHLFPHWLSVECVTPTELPSRSKQRGAVIVALVVLAGATADGIVWKLRGTPSIPQGAATPVANTQPAPTIAPLPARSHIEISVKAQDARLVLDGQVVTGNRLNLEVPMDHNSHVLEVSAPGFAPLKRTVTFARDFYLGIELQRMPPGKRFALGSRSRRATATHTNRVKAKAAVRPRDSLTAATSTVAPNRPETEIDKPNPYSP
ncbi:MAG TPA: hypothetical protein VF550_11545, partial [Polyangia bacterium]